jgi:hypothetical protein
MSRIIVSPLDAPEKTYEGTFYVAIDKYKNMGDKAGGKHRCLYITFPDYTDFAIRGQSIYCRLWEASLCVIVETSPQSVTVIMEDLEHYSPCPYEHTISWSDILAVQVAETAYLVKYV